MMSSSFRGAAPFNIFRRQPGAKAQAYSVAATLLRRHPDSVADRFARAGHNIRRIFMELTDRNTRDAAMIQEMHESGLVEFGAHTVSHANLLHLPAADARDEIAESRHDLEDLLGDEVRHFAFPYGRAGDAGPREFELCRELGSKPPPPRAWAICFPGIATGCRRCHD